VSVLWTEDAKRNRLVPLCGLLVFFTYLFLLCIFFGFGKTKPAMFLSYITSTRVLVRFMSVLYHGFTFVPPTNFFDCTLSVMKILFHGDGDPAGTNSPHGVEDGIKLSPASIDGDGGGDFFLPAGTGMGSHSPTGNSPLPSLFLLHHCEVHASTRAAHSARKVAGELFLELVPLVDRVLLE
jgi:hypothetical protein